MDNAETRGGGGRKEHGESEEKETSASACRTDQVFVKMDGGKTLQLELSPDD